MTIINHATHVLPKIFSSTPSLSKDVIEEAINRVDADLDDMITMEDMKIFCTKHKILELPSETIAAMFKAADVYNVGKLSSKDIQNVVGSRVSFTADTSGTTKSNSLVAHKREIKHHAFYREWVLFLSHFSASGRIYAPAPLKLQSRRGRNKMTETFPPKSRQRQQEKSLTGQLGHTTSAASSLSRSSSTASLGKSRTTVHTSTSSVNAVEKEATLETVDFKIKAGAVPALRGKYSSPTYPLLPTDASLVSRSFTAPLDHFEEMRKTARPLTTGSMAVPPGFTTRFSLPDNFDVKNRYIKEKGALPPFQAYREPQYRPVFCLDDPSQKDFDKCYKSKSTMLERPSVSLLDRTDDDPLMEITNPSNATNPLDGEKNEVLDSTHDESEQFVTMFSKSQNHIQLAQRSWLTPLDQGVPWSGAVNLLERKFEPVEIRWC